jgi:Tol biopolymer transport system component
MNADGSNKTQLLNMHSAEPAWSPKGDKIAFSSTIHAFQQGDIWIVNADGSGEPKRLTTDPGSDEYPAWSPDGNKMAFVRKGDIYVMNSDGSDERNLTHTAMTDENVPDWSPDGSEIAFTRSNPENISAGDLEGYPAIYKMDAAGSKEKRLTYTQGAES